MPLEGNGLTLVGAPLEVYRVLDAVYLDQASYHFPAYVRDTLAASQHHGGRFNPAGEFGALYVSLDEETVWAEMAHRFHTEGIDGLPPSMGLLRIVVQAGRYADLTGDAGRAAWDVALSDLVDDDWLLCWTLARAVRAVADALHAPSARATGTNMPLFADRQNSDLEMDLASATRASTPARFVQHSRESW